MGAARGGDRAALEQLLARHYDRIYGLCRRMTGNQADALDAAQEALMAIVRGLERFDQRASFTTWSYRVATNACLDELRRRRRRPVPGIPPEASNGTGRGYQSPERDPAQAVAERIDVDGALGRMTPLFRAAVVLRDLCDLSYEEISETLGIPVGTVRSRIARGRAALAEDLGSGGTGRRPGSVQAGEP